MASIVLDLIEEQLEEEILFLPAADVVGVFSGASAIDEDQAKSLVGAFADKGQFMGREAVEDNDGLVQALPIVVVRKTIGNSRGVSRLTECPLCAASAIQAFIDAHQANPKSFV